MAQGVRVPEAGQNDECKVPARSLSHKKMVDLLYHRTQWFSRGAVAALALKNSDVAQQQRSKTSFLRNAVSEVASS